MADTAPGKAEPAAEGLPGWRRCREAACMEKWDAPSWRGSLVHGSTWRSLSSLSWWPSGRRGLSGTSRGATGDTLGHTGGSSLLIPALTSPPAAPSPDPSSWNAPGPRPLMQPTTQLLPRCFFSRPVWCKGSILGHCPVTPCATRVPKHRAEDCPSLFGRPARPERWRSPIHQGQQGQQPLVQCSHDNRPQTPPPPVLTEALRPAGQAAARRMSVLAAGSTRSSAGHRAQPLPPFPASPGRNPSSAPPRRERVDPAADTHRAGYSLSKPQPKPWQLFLFPHPRGKDGSPFKPGGTAPPRQPSAPCGAQGTKVQLPWHTDKPRDTMSESTRPGQLENPQQSSSARWHR